MTKKIALLITLVMIFSISCVFATEPMMTTAEPTDILGEGLDVAPETTEDLSGEELIAAPTEGIEEVPSADVTPTEGVEPATSGEEATATTANTNSTVIGAVIAIVIVIAVIAIVYVLQKK